MLGHIQGRRLGQVVHLAPGHGRGIRPRQGRPATAAPFRPVVDRDVDPLRPTAGPPRMARRARDRRRRRGRGGACGPSCEGDWPRLPQLRQLLVLRSHPHTQLRQLGLQGIHGHHQPGHDRMAGQDGVGKGRSGHGGHQPQCGTNRHGRANRVSMAGQT